MLSFTRMRAMDRYVGGFLCRCFGVLNAGERRIKRHLPEEPLQLRKILVMKYFGMGSLMLASPMVRALRRRYPTARIDLLTSEQNRTVTHILPIFDNIHVVDTRNLSSAMVSMTRALRQIRHEQYDAVIDAEFFSRLSSLVAYFTRARYSVGFYLPEIWRGNFLTHPVHFNHYRHAILAFMALAKSLGATTDNYRLETVVVSDQASNSVRAALQAMGLRPEQRIVCVNVNTGPLSPERRWPEDSFLKLIRMILWEFRLVAVMLVGAGSDVPLVTRLHNLLSNEEHERVFNVAGKFDFAELCGLLKLSQVLITNDSGPLHLAESLQVPTVSFFGPETPLLYGPTGNNHVVFYKGIYCSPCLNVQNQKEAPCHGNNICMQLIRADEVFPSVKMLLEGAPISSPFRISFDVSMKQLLIDYRSREAQPSPAHTVVPATVVGKGAGHS